MLARRVFMPGQPDSSPAARAISIAGTSLPPVSAIAQARMWRSSEPGIMPSRMPRAVTASLSDSACSPSFNWPRIGATAPSRGVMEAIEAVKADEVAGVATRDERGARTGFGEGAGTDPPKRPGSIATPISASAGRMEGIGTPVGSIRSVAKTGLGSIVAASSASVMRDLIGRLIRALSRHW